MRIQLDFEELLRLLEENKVEYLIVGGYAVAFHGYPRLTKDIDFFFNNAPENVDKVRDALIRFGFPEGDLKAEMFSTEGNIITFGVEPVRVDFINEIAGVRFADAWHNRVRGKYGAVTANFIGKAELIRNKQSTSRAQDKADAEELS